MADKKNIAMNNWYKTDCENHENITVKQAYELGFNRAYGLMQTLMYKRVNSSIDQLISDDWYKILNVEETINALSSSFCMFNSRVRILGIYGFQHMTLKLEYGLDLNRIITNPSRELILESQVLNVRIHKSDEDVWDYDIEIVADVERDYYDYGKC